jgi:hypothetical protein
VDAGSIRCRCSTTPAVSASRRERCSDPPRPHTVHVTAAGATGRRAPEIAKRRAHRRQRRRRDGACADPAAQLPRAAGRR